MPDLHRSECDLCQYDKKGYWCPCKAYIKHQEARIDELEGQLDIAQEGIAELEEFLHCYAQVVALKDKDLYNQAARIAELEAYI
jgi:chromosome segregation ATPase